MRHFLCAPSPPAPLAVGMAPAATPAARSALTGRAHRRGACRPGAADTTTAVAAVAARTDENLAPAAGAEEETGGTLHRQLLPKRGGPRTVMMGYCGVNRVKARSGARLRVRPPQSSCPGSRLSSALTVYRKTLRTSPPPRSSPVVSSQQQGIRVNRIAALHAARRSVATQ